MKKFAAFLFTVTISFMAFADWTYGSASFRGNCPSNSRSIGSVQVWFNGSLTCKGTNGNTEIWEGTGDICVAFPKNYSGTNLQFTSTGGSVQIQYLK
ncbi:MAG: hypothetical protein J1E16_00055 [Muribaculaceae bacterium]|nr:hypothetical protein [Muribaculaceae bacterium]